MNRFTIQKNEYLSRDTLAFYHADYFGSGGQRHVEGTIENVVCTLKNDITPYSADVLERAVGRLSSFLSADLPQILLYTRLNKLTVCVVPRAKVHYNPNQLLFKATVRNVATHLNGFNDGTNYIVRHTDTRTTHRNKAGFGGNGQLPYPGITADTCNIVTEVEGKDILLIDDVYTRTVNIDEDAIQALLNKGVNSVIFYAIGRTV
ncbi:MAG: amidophosphoribosyltransferase [Bacteroidales bacterium]|jgi:hypothetical protein